MLRGIGLGFSCDTVETLEQQAAQRPAGAVAGEHVEVVDVEIGFTVRLPDFRRINVRQPVVGNHLAGNVEDQPAERIALVGVSLDAPVGAVDVLVDRGLDIDQRLARVAQPAMLVAVGHIGPEGVQVIGFDQDLLDDILHLLDCRVRS